jgi:hypothetical protein
VLTESFRVGFKYVEMHTRESKAGIVFQYEYRVLPCLTMAWALHACLILALLLYGRGEGVHGVFNNLFATPIY